MLFMVIETFRDNDVVPVYQRLRDQGRGLPSGLRYVNSWVTADLGRCFQVMECDDLRVLQQWVLHWRGSGASFEIVPIISGSDTQETVQPLLGPTDTAYPGKQLR